MILHGSLCLVSKALSLLFVLDYLFKNGHTANSFGKTEIVFLQSREQAYLLSPAGAKGRHAYCP